MLEGERHRIINNLLSLKGFVRVGDLVDRTGVSEATIRRDLTRMEKEGLLRRVHGGAELSPAAGGQRTGKAPGRQEVDGSGFELPLESRKNLHVREKGRIAAAAVSLIEDGETIIIDGGSTTFHMLESLMSKQLTVITNSFAMAGFLVKNSRSQVIVPEGMIYPDSQLILSPFETAVLQNYSASKVFMGAEGIDAKGITNTNALLIQAERAMIERASELIILADSSKFHRHGHLRLCGFDKVSIIITDAGIDTDSKQTAEAAGVKIIIAE
jgi:DeoR family ulaG and ulaABCDEF operon transcriptional repressor